MKTAVALSGVLAAALALSLSPAFGDHNSPWGMGHANMPNDIHNTRLDGDMDLFREFVQQGFGAESINRCLLDPTLCPGATEAAVEVEAAEGTAGPVGKLTATLNPLPAYQGRGRGNYMVFDADAKVSRVLNVNVRLRLIRRSGGIANQDLGLSVDNASATVVNAYLSRSLPGDEFEMFAVCSLPFVEVIVTDDGTPLYATYKLALREDAAGELGGSGGCVDVAGSELLPGILPLDLVEIGVQTPVLDEEAVPVLTGSF